jgi:hypothetical protein
MESLKALFLCFFMIGEAVFEINETNVWTRLITSRHRLDSRAVAIKNCREWHTNMPGTPQARLAVAFPEHTNLRDEV